MLGKLAIKLHNKAYLGLALGAVVCAIIGFVIGEVFFEYRQTIISQQEEQLLTIARSVASSITHHAESYMQDLATIEGYLERIRPEGALEKSGMFAVFAREYVASQQPNVQNMFLTSADGAMVAAVREGYDYKRVYQVSHGSSRWQQAIYEDASGKYYIGLSRIGADHSRITIILDIKVIFDKIVSHVRVGRKGYVMIKDGNGLILMHPVTEQIGLDVLKGRERQYPDYDFTQLKKLIERQRQGREGIYTYNSYWWADNMPQKVRKISAYTPIRFEAGFLIVSAVMDYNDIADPVTAGVIKIALLAVLMLGILIALAVLLLRSIRSHNQIQRENQYLRDLNVAQEELHQNEQQLAHYQRLQTIATLTGGIAHEFNNLLTPIMGYSGRILSMLAKDDELYEDVEEIYNSSVKAKEIIMQISTLNRRDVELTYKRLEIGAVVAGALKTADSVKPSNINLVKAIEFKSSHIMGNEIQIHQVILNLCANAYQAMEDGGTLTVRGEIVSKWDLNDKLVVKKDFSRYAKLSFEDTGKGIEAAVLPRIFDPFFTTKPMGEGTGLGLSIVQNIIESHGGGIAVTSTPGAGSVFIVYLPLAIEADEKGGMSSRKTDGALAVALVSKNSRLMKRLNAYLSPLGYTLRCFDHPKDLLKTLESGCYFQVVVVEELRARMNGAEVALKVLERASEVKILVIVDLVEKELLEAKQKRIIDDYLPKAAGYQEIGSRIDRLAKGS